MSDTLPPRWYVVDRDGLATLCKDEEDAKNTAADVRVAFPRRRPYRAVLLGDVAAERERCAKLCDAVAVDDMTGYGIASDCANKIRATPCTTAPSDGQ
jgi:hypothetical protein